MTLTAIRCPRCGKETKDLVVHLGWECEIPVDAGEPVELAVGTYVRLASQEGVDQPEDSVPKGVVVAVWDGHNEDGEPTVNVEFYDWPLGRLKRFVRGAHELTVTATEPGVVAGLVKRMATEVAKVTSSALPSLTETDRQLIAHAYRLATL